jgi:hypothetical protein
MPLSRNGPLDQNSLFETTELHKTRWMSFARHVWSKEWGCQIQRDPIYCDTRLSRIDSISQLDGTI